MGNELYEINRFKEKNLNRLTKYHFGTTIMLGGKCYMIKMNYNREIFLYSIKKVMDSEGALIYDFNDKKLEFKMPPKSKALDIKNSIIKKERALDGKGNIYLITDGEHTKIGTTSYPVKKRLQELQTGNSRRLKIVYFYHVKNKISTEAFLHKKFKDRHILGEWFDLKYEDVSSIINDKISIEKSIIGLSEEEMLKVDGVLDYLNSKIEDEKHKILKKEHFFIKTKLKEYSRRIPLKEAFTLKLHKMRY